MKIYGGILLVLSAFQPASAFLVETPKSLSTKATNPTEGYTPTFSYLGSLGESRVSDGRVGEETFTTSADGTRAKALEAVESRLASLDQARRSSLEQSSGDAVKKIFAKAPKVQVQGGSLKTWSFASTQVDRLQVVMKTEGRPLDADVELWQGPDNTPHKMRVYIEDGSKRPFNAVIETPRGPNTVAIRNTANLEFPLQACVTAEGVENGSAKLAKAKAPGTIQGGALKTFPFDPAVESVQVLLKTDGRPLNARIELLQGPNNNKQVIELYTEDGMTRPFYSIIETPGTGNVVRVVNTAPIEFPMSAWVEPYKVGSTAAYMEPVIGGDSDGFNSAPMW